ncbi:hypothetical protein [Clostridium felsineum]|uniref:hypothetical protein n=1 Tax=Clostridium felsineum TaxID=36839 RepID=UPI0020342CA9|nr:hypothetical protein [Clostridium felsineum]URZ00185.1 hypothetical protein CLAUR_001730 [Clostridium felsineum]
MEKIIGNAKRIQTGIGYFELGASISVANNLILGLPGLLGVYNDKRLIYKLENEKRYGVLAAYQYGRVAGDLEGEIQGTIELFSGLSIMGFGGLGAGALTVATDGAAAPAVPAVESVGIAVAAHGIGMTTSSLSHMGSDFAKGNFYFSEMKSKSKFKDVFNSADNYSLSKNTYENHILDRHGVNSSYTGKSHFNSNFNIKEGILSTLTGDKFIVKSNTANRTGYIFEQTFDKPIGVNSKGKPLYTLKVVIDNKGNVITAFPKK